MATKSSRKKPVAKKATKTAVRTVRPKKKKAAKKPSGQGATPPQRITHILKHSKLGKQFKGRVDSIVKQFPKAKVVELEKDSDKSVLDKIRELFPEIEGSSAKAVSVAKKILVIGKATKKTLVAPFEFDKDMVCPHFHKIVPMSNGCIFNCEYCYLQATYRGKFPYIKLNVNWEAMIDEMEKVVAEERKQGRPVYFNMGELMDSLSFDSVTGLIPFLMENLESDDFKGAELLLLTKSSETANLIKYAKKYPKAKKRIIVSWSINSQIAAGTYEHGSADTISRLKASSKVQSAGYKIRIRIDPMIPFDGWEKDYTRLVDLIYAKYKLKPDVITLGSLRHEHTLIPIAEKRFPNTDLFDFRMVKSEGDKRRLPFEQRLQMYQTVMDAVGKHDKKTLISLCKERDMMWVKLGANLSDTATHACNCVSKWTFGDIRSDMPDQAIELPKHEIKDIPLNHILDDDTHRYRSPEAIEGMKESIADSGVLYPIDVIRVKKGKYQIVNGFRRTLGIAALGKTSIPARVFTKLNKQEIKRLKGAENHARKTMDPVETYRFIADCKKDKMTVPEIVKAFSLQERQVRKYSVIYDQADDPIKEQFMNGDISVTEAYNKAQGKEGAQCTPDGPVKVLQQEIEKQVSAYLGKDHGITFKVKQSGDSFKLSAANLLSENDIAAQFTALAKVFKSKEVKNAMTIQ